MKYQHDELQDTSWLDDSLNDLENLYNSLLINTQVYKVRHAEALQALTEYQPMTCEIITQEQANAYTNSTIQYREPIKQKLSIFNKITLEQVIFLICVIVCLISIIVIIKKLI